MPQVAHYTMAAPILMWHWDSRASKGPPNIRVALGFIPLQTSQYLNYLWFILKIFANAHSRKKQCSHSLHATCTFNSTLLNNKIVQPLDNLGALYTRSQDQGNSRIEQFYWWRAKIWSEWPLYQESRPKYVKITYHLSGTISVPNIFGPSPTKHFYNLQNQTPLLEPKYILIKHLLKSNSRFNMELFGPGISWS